MLVKIYNNCIPTSSQIIQVEQKVANKTKVFLSAHQQTISKYQPEVPGSNLPTFSEVLSFHPLIVEFVSHKPILKVRLTGHLIRHCLQ